METVWAKKSLFARNSGMHQWAVMLTRGANKQIVMIEWSAKEEAVKLSPCLKREMRIKAA